MHCDVQMTMLQASNKTGSSSDEWTYYQLVTHSLFITLKYKQYIAVADLHSSQHTVAHAL
jgi:hypothetical protein